MKFYTTVTCNKINYKISDLELFVGNRIWNICEIKHAHCKMFLCVKKNTYNLGLSVTEAWPWTNCSLRKISNFKRISDHRTMCVCHQPKTKRLIIIKIFFFFFSSCLYVSNGTAYFLEICDNTVLLTEIYLMKCVDGWKCLLWFVEVD